MKKTLYEMLGHILIVDKTLLYYQPINIIFMKILKSKYMSFIDMKTILLLEKPDLTLIENR